VISKRREAARRWRHWFTTGRPMAELKRTMDRKLFFGEEGPEQFAAGLALADHPGPELATLPKGTLIVPNDVERV
jgi:hypothetical protein